jgi:hypothetical protein
MLLKAAASLKRLKTVLGRVGQRNSDTQHFVCEMCMCDSGKFGTKDNQNQEQEQEIQTPRHQGCQRGHHSFQIFTRPFPSLHGHDELETVAHHSSFLLTRGSPGTEGGLCYQPLPLYYPTRAV